MGFSRKERKEIRDANPGQNLSKKDIEQARKEQEEKLKEPKED